MSDEPPSFDIENIAQSIAHTSRVKPHVWKKPGTNPSFDGLASDLPAGCYLTPSKKCLRIGAIFSKSFYHAGDLNSHEPQRDPDKPML